MASNDEAPLPRRGIYFITQPRSATNVFQQMMSKQPGYQNSAYWFLWQGFMTLPRQLEQGPLTDMTESDLQGLWSLYQESFDKLLTECASAAANGNQIIVKEHAAMMFQPSTIARSIHPADHVRPCHVKDPSDPCPSYTNPTCLLDSFLLSMQPVFQIGHPIRTLPSMLRASRDSFALGQHVDDVVPTIYLTLRYSREVYDWYASHPAARQPFVIDADDVVNDPERIRKLCDGVGLDYEELLLEWPELTPAAHPIVRRFMSTFQGSKGLVRGIGSQGLVFEEEQEKWKAEFGEVEGAKLAVKVAKAMEDYEYLHSKRVSLEERGAGDA